MLSNHQLYYLQTMGIHPWVLRKDASQPLLLVLIEDINLSQDEQMLLDAMFQSVGLDSTQIGIKPFSKDVLQSHKASVVMVLGDIQEDCEGVIILPSLADLLEYPIKKRKAYEALGCCISKV
ncbi:MAG: hypothetical protein K0U37_00755 [Gammaproteobacteria bacterium]|nr:hypothetical protein [Gammaproteobacteria bacterium]